MLLVSPNLGWSHLVMSPKDFIAFVEIIERSKLVESSYVNGETVWTDRNDVKSKVQAEMFTATIYTMQQYEEMKKEAENG